jgi:hypothetical protein
MFNIDNSLNNMLNGQNNLTRQVHKPQIITKPQFNTNTISLQLKQLLDKLPEVKQVKGNFVIVLEDGSTKTLNFSYK